MEPVKLSWRDLQFIKELTGNEERHESCKEQKELLDNVSKDQLPRELGELGISIERDNAE